MLDFGNGSDPFTPDDVAKRLSASGGVVSRRVLEGFGLEGYREQTLTLCQVSEMLGLSPVETEDFLAHKHVLAVIDEADFGPRGSLKSKPRPRNRGHNSCPYKSL